MRRPTSAITAATGDRATSRARRAAHRVAEHEEAHARPIPNAAHRGTRRRGITRREHRAVNAACRREPAVRDYPVPPVPFTAVHLDRCVLGAAHRDQPPGEHPVRLPAVRAVGPHGQLRPRRDGAARRAVLEQAAAGYPFDDTDVYKVIEGAAYTLSVQPDPKLEAYVDDLIEKIAAAQEPDGYLYTTRSIDPQHPHPWAGHERWTLEKVDSHELYNLGHLYEAAVAYYQATGKRTLLDVALKTADLLDRDVRPGQAGDLAGPPDHRDGPGEAVPRHRRAEVPRPREVPARRARARRRRGRGPRVQPVAPAGRRAGRGGRATPCAPPTCTRAWPTSRRSPATPRT